MTQARTERAEYHFKVSEFVDGTPWISTEPMHDGIPFLEQALLGFELSARTTLEQAQKIAEFLNDNIQNVNVTIFDSHPMYGRGSKAS